MSIKNETHITAEPGKQEVLITREFNASRELVFQAFTDPKLIIRWLGPRGLTMTIDKFDRTTGGYYRYVQTDPHGNNYAFNGVVHEALFPERIIQTFEFEGLPERGHVLLETIKFEELDNERTKVTVQSIYQSLADRDGMLQAGMAHGVNDSHARLDQMLMEYTKS